MIDQVTVLGVLALGMTAVIVIGGIDLSVGAVLALAMMVLGWLSHDGGLPMSLAIVGALAAGAAAGFVNGAADHNAKLPAFIATLAMFSRRARVGQRDHRRPADRRLPGLVRQPGLEPPVRLALGHGRLLIVLYVAGWAFLRYRANGRALYALGGSAEVARLAGLHDHAG